MRRALIPLATAALLQPMPGAASTALEASGWVGGVQPQASWQVPGDETEQSALGPVAGGSVVLGVPFGERVVIGGQVAGWASGVRLQDHSPEARLETTLPWGGEASAVLRWRLNSESSLIVSLGLAAAMLRVEVERPDGGVDSRTTAYGPAYGVGLQRRLDGAWSMRAELRWVRYNRFTWDEGLELEVEAVSGRFGAVYSF